MLKIGVLLVSITSIIVLPLLCHAARWPNPDAQCPTDSVINATCSCHDDGEEKRISCVSDVYKSPDGNKESDLFEITVFDNDHDWHPNLVSGVSVQLKCWPIENIPLYFDIVHYTSNLLLDIESVQDLTITNCYTTSSYTKILHSFGIHSFTDESYLKLSTSGHEKHIDIDLTADSFADTKSLYSNLKRLILQGDGIRSITRYTFEPFQHLKELTIHSTSLFELPENLFFNMPLLKTVSIFQNEKLLSLPKQIFNPNNNIEILDLTHNEQVHDLPRSILAPLKHLKALNIGSNNFSVIPPDLLHYSCAKLTKLVIKEDFYKCPTGCIRNLPSELLSSCRKLREFSYSFHRIHEKNRLKIPANFFEFQNSTLKMIEIDNANLQKDQLFDLFFNRSSFKKSFVNLNTLSIEGNAINCKETFCSRENNAHCDCNLVTKLGQLSKNITGNFTQTSNFRVTCNDGPHQIQKVNVEDISNIYLPYCEQIDLKTIIFYVVGIAIFLLSVLVVLCVKERILIWLYNHSIFSKIFEIKFTETRCVCDMHPSHADCRSECFCRDAFISYSQDDEKFALLLRDNLEDNGSLGPENTSQKQMAGRSFSCMDHQRDWKAGNPIALNISESIDRSQCTLILLSQSFLNSEYCNQEFDLAYQSKKLIVVMMDVEEFDSNGNILTFKENHSLDLTNHSMITIYLKQYTYLKQSDIMKNWGKIAYHLPYRRMPRANNEYELYSHKTDVSNILPESV